jgi:hypothetical protein
MFMREARTLPPPNPPWEWALSCVLTNQPIIYLKHTHTTPPPNKTRDQEIQRIAQSIEEIAHVMKHLAELVIDQGTVLDRIDYNMDQVCV